LFLSENPRKHLAQYGALASQKAAPCRGELRNQGFSAPGSSRHVKTLDFQEARGNLFGLSFGYFLTKKK
jgi:hypothetical protein